MPLASVASVLRACGVVVIVAVAIVVVGSDVDVNAQGPICRLYWFVYNVSCTRSEFRIGVADVSCIIFMP